MNSTTEVAARIENRYWGEISSDDSCMDLRKIIQSGCATEQFLADLLFFTEAIDGYASSARALPGCDDEKLRKVRLDLSRPFFERYPEYEGCRKIITKATTPKLHESMTRLENYRRDLLSLVESVINKRHP